MSKPEVDSVAPDFTAVAVGAGEAPHEVTLSALRDKPVVLYFYPKDDTPGCTAQACGLRDVWGELTRKAHLFGVSADPVKSHETFIAKYGLPFPLLSDVDTKLANAYGVWVEKNLYGKKYMGMERSTFVIGTDGKIRAVFEKVKPDEHADLVLAALG